MANDMKERAQKLAGSDVKVLGAWQEPSMWVDADGNKHTYFPVTGYQERPGCVMVSNGQFIGRGDSLENAVADLLENVSK